MTGDHFKRLETLRAKAALAGWCLHPIRSDLERYAFVLTRNAETFEFDSLDQVESWLSSGACHEGH